MEPITETGGEPRRAINPKVLMAIAAAVLAISTAIAIFMAVSYTPESRDGRTTTTVTTTTTSASIPANR